MLVVVGGGSFEGLNLRQPTPTDGQLTHSVPMVSPYFEGGGFISSLGSPGLLNLGPGSWAKPWRPDPNLVPNPTWEGPARAKIPLHLYNFATSNLLPLTTPFQRVSKYSGVGLCWGRGGGGANQPP